MAKALVIGGTGPTGPHIVEGLLARGYDVTVFHGGLHEVPFSRDVEHIHNDPHFADSFAEAIAGRRWDLTIATYGRLQIATQVLKGHTDRLIAVGGATGGAAGRDDPRWGPLGPPSIMSPDRTILETNIEANKFRYRMAEAELSLFQAARDGHYSATYVGYPLIYGPRQPGPNDWSIIRRILDGRRQFVIADGGLKLESRAYVENAAQAVLTVVDQPEVSSGKKYTISDEDVLSLRQRIDFFTNHFRHVWDLIDMPYDWAIPAHPLWRFQRQHSLVDSSKIRQELGYRDIVPKIEALRRAAEWLAEHPISPGSAEEQQLGDPFDYEKEDQLIFAWRNCEESRASNAQWRIDSPGHMYRHPAKPNEPWRRR